MFLILYYIFYFLEFSKIIIFFFLYQGNIQMKSKINEKCYIMYNHNFNNYTIYNLKC